MRISVVIPNYNDRRIERAVASVRAQDYADYELIISDGGSTDPELLEWYQGSGADQLVIERDHGIFDGMNRGIARATGDLVFIMGTDDELSGPRVFSDVAAAFAAEPSLDGVCIGCRFVDAAGRVVRTWFPRRVTRRRILWGILPPHLSLFLRRDLYHLVGPFKWREFEDVACDIVWLMDLAIAREGLRIEMLPQHHLRMEYGGASTGSAGAVFRQFTAVARYAREKSEHLPLWPLYSPIRTFSKVTQFRLPSGRISRGDG